MGSQPKPHLCITIELYVKRSPRQEFIGLKILINGLGDNIIGKQIITLGIGLEPVSDILLVKGGLTLPRLIPL